MQKLNKILQLERPKEEPSCDQASQLVKLYQRHVIICEQSDSLNLYEFFLNEVIPFLRHLHLQIVDNLYDQRFNDMLVNEYANRCYVAEQGVKKFEIVARELGEQNRDFTVAHEEVNNRETKKREQLEKDFKEHVAQVYKQIDEDLEGARIIETVSG